MKSQKIALCTLFLTIALMPINTGAIFTKATLKTENFLSKISRYISNFFSRGTLVSPQNFISKTHISTYPFVQKSQPFSSFPLHLDKTKKYSADLKPIQKMPPRETYIKSDQTQEAQKNVVKKMFFEGPLAPSILSKKMYEKITTLNKNPKLEHADDTITLSYGPFKISSTLIKENKKYYIDAFLAQKNGKIEEKICEAHLPISFHSIKPSNLDLVIGEPGMILCSQNFRQTGVGFYFLNLLVETLKKFKNANVVIYPNPFDLPAGQTSTKLLPILKKYYEGFGFREDPLDKDFMNLFFRNGKNVYMPQKINSLLKAISINDEAKIKELFASGVPADWESYASEPTIIFSIQHDFLDLVPLLIKWGAETTLQDRYGKTALDIAKKLDRQEIVTLLEEVIAKQNGPKKLIFKKE